MVSVCPRVAFSVCTCVSLTVEVLGASGLDSEMVYMISRVWLPASSFFQG